MLGQLLDEQRFGKRGGSMLGFKAEE